MKKPSPLRAAASSASTSSATKQKDALEKTGESGQTFHGMMRWVRKHKPAIIVQENVCAAPWDHMVEQYREAGYLE